MLELKKNDPEKNKLWTTCSISGNLFGNNINDVFYVETVHNKIMNSFISRNYEILHQKFAAKKYNFKYFPKELEAIDKEISTKEILQYFNPQLRDCDINLPTDLTDCIYKSIFEKLENQVSLDPCLLKIMLSGPTSKSTLYYNFIFEIHEGISDDELFAQIDKFLDTEIPYKRSSPLFNFCITDTDDVEILKTDIIEKIKLLKQLGANLSCISGILEKNVNPSPLLVDSEYRIILTAFNNLEIQMEPLPKSLYFLFLRHKDGFTMAELENFKPELLQIYRQITNRENDEKIMSSIDSVCKPGNAFYEKCSRIKEAFISKIAEDIAINYTVFGKKIKKIHLDDNMITIEAYFGD